jgi:hypothetical protein
MKSLIPKLRILIIREQRVLLDSDLARLYGVETRALNQAVKRNLDRFPPEFSFVLTRDEILSISQTVTSLDNLKFFKSVRVFTEHGALQAANVLNSPQAAQMSLYVIRAFVKMREELATNATILKRLAETVVWFARQRTATGNTPITAPSMRDFIVGKWQGQGKWEFFIDGSLAEGEQVCNYRFIDADHIRVEIPSRPSFMPGEAYDPITIPAESDIYSVSISNEVLTLTTPGGSALAFRRACEMMEL